MRVLACGLSDVGNVRAHNEDTILVRPEFGLYLVCDGVGGHLGGKTASQTAAQVIETELQKHKEFIQRLRSRSSAITLSTSELQQLQRMVETAIEAACLQVYQRGHSDAALRGMATTVDLVLTVGEYAILGHVGDSRVYLVRSGKLHQLTEDHSVASEMAKQGMIPAAAIKQSPYAHVLSRAVGFESAVQVDTLAAELMPGDVFVLCSDGFHDYLTAGDPEKLFKGFPKNDTELKAFTTTLIAHAKSRGGKDNISAITLAVYSSEPRDVEVTDPHLQRPRPSAELKVEVVRNIPLFQHLSYSEIVKVLQISEQKHFEPGTLIFKEGEPGKEMLVTLSGNVDVLRKGVHLTTRGRGTVMGEMSVIDLAPRSASVKATSATDVLLISRERLFTLLRAEPRLAVKLLWSLCSSLNSRLRETTERLVELEETPKENDKPTSELPFTQGQSQ